jgi:hypothetical protein
MNQIFGLQFESGDQGARMASFSIIGHQMCNWEWNEILQNEITGTQTSFSTNFGGNLRSFISPLSFFFLSASTAAATYVFHSSTTIITLEPRALNAEFQN